MIACPSGAPARARLATLPLALSLALPVLAQSTPSGAQLRETVVSANRTEQLLTDALPHTTVIGREAIERSQAVDLPALLASEAGFQVVQSGGRGATTSLFLRGSASLQMLVLVDGVPMTRQDSTGAISLEHLMLDQIERVEVVRGNVSAIYGSGAIGGVVQVFTRAGAGGAPSSSLRLEAGSYGSARAAVNLATQAGGTRVNLGLSRHTTRGFSSMNPVQVPNENPDADGYRNTSYALGLNHELAAGHSLALRAQGSDGRFAIDGGGWGSPTDEPTSRNTLDTWSLTSRNRLTADWRSELSYGEGRERSIYDATRTAYPYDSEATTRTRTLNWTHALALGGGLATFGAEWQRQAIDTRDSYDTRLARTRDVRSLFAGWSATRGAQSLQLNLRRDRPEGQDGKTTGYAGWGLQLDPQWKLVASASTAFNLPPLGYLYDPFAGNPALRPETAHSAEVGLQWAEGGRVARATLFRTRTRELMLYDPASFTFGNVHQAVNQGLEVSASGPWAGADWRASLTLQDPKDEATGERLVRRARQLAALGVSRPVGGWVLGGELRLTGARPDKAGTPGLPGYGVVNLTARYRLGPQLNLTARVENLADKAYQTAWGYNQPGRSVWVGLVWSRL